MKNFWRTLTIKNLQQNYIALTKINFLNKRNNIKMMMLKNQQNKLIKRNNILTESHNHKSKINIINRLKIMIKIKKLTEIKLKG